MSVSNTNPTDDDKKDKRSLRSFENISKYFVFSMVLLRISLPGLLAMATPAIGQFSKTSVKLFSTNFKAQDTRILLFFFCIQVHVLHIALVLHFAAVQASQENDQALASRHTQREVTEAFLFQIPSLRLHTVKDVLSCIKTIISEIRFYVY